MFETGQKGDMPDKCYCVKPSKNSGTHPNHTSKMSQKTPIKFSKCS